VTITVAREPRSLTARREPASEPWIRNSMTGSVWTVVSRTTGLVQSVAVATVLGATYLGNTYQAINSLPNIVYYQLLAGSLFASILVPPIVERIDSGDRAGAEALARGFYGTLLAIGAIACVLLAFAGPAILRVFTLGVADPAAAVLERRIGLLFLLMFIPQIVCYLTAGTSGAVMNANGRFALAAGAPALENAGMITTLVLVGVIFGTGTALADVTTGQVLLLGLGTTASVALHATATWLGASRSGIRLVPVLGWRDPHVRTVLRKAFTTLGYTGLAALQTVAYLVMANRLEGGLVAFQLGLNFFFLPIAIVAWPVARSMLPHLSRLSDARTGDQPPAFWLELTRAIRLASFATLPMAVGYAVLAMPIARAISLGQLEADGGAPLVAMTLATLSLAVVGETWFIIGAHAFYARGDVRSPLRSMMVRTTVVAVLLAATLATRQPMLVGLLGLVLATGTVVGSINLWSKLRRGAPGHLPWRDLRGTAVACAVMAVPSASIATLLTRWIGGTELGQIGVVLGAATIGAVTYVVVQAMMGAPEVSMLSGRLVRLGRRGD
jgi:putative peptidoglycan lipid II flippase